MINSPLLIQFEAKLFHDKIIGGHGSKAVQAMWRGLKRLKNGPYPKTAGRNEEQVILRQDLWESLGSFR